MARFEGSRERTNRSSSRSGPPRGDRNKGRTNFRDSSRGGDDRKFSNRDSRGTSRDYEMTRVTCSSCGTQCEVPFKPTSSKPVYCNACFAKKDRVTSDTHSNKDFDIINEKLNKIMKAMNIK